jgi:hypothetical protein
MSKQSTKKITRYINGVKQVISLAVKKTDKKNKKKK